MKTKNLLLSLLVTLFIASCTKEEITPFNDSGNTANSTEEPVVFGKNGKQVKRIYSEWFTATSTITPTEMGVFNPGSGNGNATHMGKATNYFNQMVTFSNGQPVGSTAAPVNQFFATELAAAGITNVPNSVSSITFDNDGNSVWFTSTTGTNLKPINATKVFFTANLDIIGGTGKFYGATGKVILSGFFNPQSASQSAVMQSSGTITY